MPKYLPKRSNFNKHVSSSVLSRSERSAILGLRVVTGVGRRGSTSSRQRSEVWNYFGYLHSATTSEDEPIPSTSSGSGTFPQIPPVTAINDNRIYCR